NNNYTPCSCSDSQCTPVPSTTFCVDRLYPASPGGPVVRVDQTHCNAYSLLACSGPSTYRPCTAASDCPTGESCVPGRLTGFKRLLELDGYQFAMLGGRDNANRSIKYTSACGVWDEDDDGDEECQCAFCDQLQATDTLVIDNAKCTMSQAEADFIAGWVADGGHLLLVADHQGFPCAIDNLADEFEGITWYNEYVTSFSGLFCNAAVETHCGGTEGDIIPNSYDGLFFESVGRVQTFTGSSIDIGPGSPVLELPATAQ